MGECFIFLLREMEIMTIDKKFHLKQHQSLHYSELDIAKNVLNVHLRPKQKQIVREFFQKDKDGKPLYQEFMLVCGKKGGKTFITVVINLILVYKWILMEDPYKKFGIIPQDVYLLNTCAGKNQSIDVYMNQVRGILSQSSFLNDFKKKEIIGEILFNHPSYENFHLILKAQSSRSTSSLGYLCFSVTFDELAWFEDNQNRNSSQQIYSALYPNIKPFGGWGYSFILSSPSDSGTWFYSHYEFAKKSPSKYVVQYPTWIMNPNISRESLDEEFKRDYEKALMDYGAEFVEKVGGAFSVEKIEQSMRLDILDFTVGDKRQRVIALDPGLKHDAYALVMGYTENNITYIDYANFWQGTRHTPVKISDVEEHIKVLCKNFIVSKIVLDQRYSASTIQRLSDEGYPIFETFFDGGYKQKMYQRFKEKLNMDEVFLPRFERIKSELIALRRKGSGANIQYEAPTTGAIKTDDMADAVANCVFQLSVLNEHGGTDDFILDNQLISSEEEEKSEKDLENEKKELKSIEDEGGFVMG